MFLGVSTSLTSTLNILANSGEARFLAEPKLVCRSGGVADFLAGGEVPIPDYQCRRVHCGGVQAIRHWPHA